jgi:beta-glucosidase
VSRLNLRKCILSLANTWKMNMNVKQSVLSLIIALFAINLYAHTPATENTLPWYNEWPTLPAKVPDLKQVFWVLQRMEDMSLEEKVAQMLMVEYQAITPNEAKTYKIGAMLHGSGQVNLANKPVSNTCRNANYLTLSCWNELADLYWNALQKAQWKHHAKPIPLLWGTDAIHGAGAIYGATLFPQNINLGAALVGNPLNYNLLYQMQKATREQVALQGFRQIFAPVVAVARNRNWGRYYESYSENPVIAYHASPFAVTGIQTPWYENHHQQTMLATLKHFVGDGGTTTGTGIQTQPGDDGIDPTDEEFLEKRTERGLNEYSEELLINVHAPGYFSGIKADVASIMASFSSWENGKLHGDRYLLTRVLKNTLNFNGFIVSDWDGIKEVEGCTIYSCPKAVNAGIDLFMFGFETPNAWKIFHKNVVEQVKSGEIPIERINDAVSRILAAKYKMGLLHAEKPSKTYKAFGYHSIKAAQNKLDQWHLLARRIAQKSMVLLKNQDKTLPYKPYEFKHEPLLVAGQALDSPQMLIGGFGLQWQGLNPNVAEPFHNKQDYPQSVTVLDALQHKGVQICHYQTGNEPCIEETRKALVVMGEHSYAEWYGDIHVSEIEVDQTIEYQSIREQYAADEALVAELKSKGYEVTTVFFSGRPLIVEALDKSDAFIAGFLPGSQGGNALVDLLFAHHGINFEARLPFSWPMVLEDSVLNSKPGNFSGSDSEWLDTLAQGNAHEILVDSADLYPYGFGLNYE